MARIPRHDGAIASRGARGSRRRATRDPALRTQPGSLLYGEVRLEGGDGVSLRNCVSPSTTTSARAPTCGTSRASKSASSSGPTDATRLIHSATVCAGAVPHSARQIARLKECVLRFTHGLSRFKEMTPGCYSRSRETFVGMIVAVRSRPRRGWRQDASRSYQKSNKTHPLNTHATACEYRHDE